MHTVVPAALSIHRTNPAARCRSHYSRRSACFVLAFALLGNAAATWAQAQHSFAEEVEARAFALINDFRNATGLQPIEREARLGEAARYFVDYMAAHGKLDHQADGTTPAARVKQRGYDYCIVSENIAYVYDSRGFTPERLAHHFVEGWEKSPGHRANILDADITQTGLAVARSANNKYYAAQLFARPRSDPRAGGPQAGASPPSSRRARGC